jgi:Helix-turn-helix of insertion element transposase
MKALPNPVKEQAAQLIAEGRFEFGEIADKVGVDRKTLLRWRKDPKFNSRVDGIRNDFAEATKHLAIRRKDYRIGVLNAKHSKLLTLIEERAADPTMAEIPGGSTGLIVRTMKVSGETVVPEYVFDRAVLQELRALEEQASKELGQIVDKRELTGKDGGPLQHEHAAGHMTNAEIETEIGELFGSILSAAAAGSGKKSKGRNPSSNKSRKSPGRQAKK